MLSPVATDAGPHCWDPPEALLLTSTAARPLFDELHDALGQSETASSWLLARLWRLTGGSVGVQDGVDQYFGAEEEQIFGVVTTMPLFLLLRIFSRHSVPQVDPPQLRDVPRTLPRFQGHIVNKLLQPPRTLSGTP